MPSAESSDFVAVGLAVGTEEDIACGRERRDLAIVDRDVFVPVGEMNHHEAAAADIARARIGHGHREAGGDRRVDGVAALPHDLGADARRNLLLRHDHAMFGKGRMHRVERRRRVDETAALLRLRRNDQRSDKRNHGEYLTSGHDTTLIKRFAAACDRPGVIVML